MQHQNTLTGPLIFSIEVEKPMKLNGLLIFAALILVGCVSSSVERIGTVSYTPRPPNSEVVVFTDANQIKEPYDVVGIISYDNPGKYQILTLGDAIKPLKTKAREIGANAIIIDKSQPVKSGIMSTGIRAEARAVRLNGRP
jgi:PBP1b-binding outer membrane lipoprotein LpoB